MGYYVQRSAGVIVAAYAQRQVDVDEYLEDDDAELQAFRDPPGETTPGAYSVTARQFKMQLVIAGLKNQVDAWVAEQDELVKVAYEYSGTFVSVEPMLQAGFQELGFTEQQREEFFLAASKL